MEQQYFLCSGLPFIPTHPKLVEVPNFLIVGVLESRVFICQCFVITGVFENSPLCHISSTLAKESRSRVTVANFEISNFAHFVSPAHQSFTHKSDSDSSVFFKLIQHQPIIIIMITQALPHHTWTKPCSFHVSKSVNIYECFFGAHMLKIKEQS